MNEMVRIGGRGAGKSFQAGYKDGYAKREEEIASAPPTLDEVRWLHKLCYALFRGAIKIQFVGVPIPEPKYTTYAEKQVYEHRDRETGKYIKSLNDEIRRLTEENNSLRAEME